MFMVMWSMRGRKVEWVECDFRCFYCFGVVQFASLIKRISSCFFVVECAMVVQNGGDFDFSFCYLDEIIHEVFFFLFDEEGFFVQFFDMGGEMGWVHWDPKDVCQVVEFSFGCGVFLKIDVFFFDFEQVFVGGFAVVMVVGVVSEFGYEMINGEGFVEKRFF